MNNYHRNFFIMPTLARFELETHTMVEEGKPLSADTLIDLMASLFKEGYGDEVYYDHDPIGITGPVRAPIHQLLCLQVHHRNKRCTCISQTHTGGRPRSLRTLPSSSKPGDHGTLPRTRNRQE